MTVHILSAGAAKGLVHGAAPAFAKASGHAIDGAFGAVGAMREKYAALEPCDVIVLTAAMIAELMRDGEVLEGSARDLGRVRTGVAVPAQGAAPPIADRAQLRAALEQASAVYLPDPQRATAGIHVVKVIGQLGLADALAPRIRAFPNGAAAMAAMAAAGDARAIGLTQVTEILYTEGVQLAGALPAEFELSTVYTAGVTRRAADPVLAARLVAFLGGPESLALRRAGGFE